LAVDEFGEVTAARDFAFLRVFQAFAHFGEGSFVFMKQRLAGSVAVIASEKVALA
jgi:hypothetical protein